MMNKTHTETFVVRASECDLFRRMRMDALFLSMQEIGERHASELGFGYKEMMDRGLFFALSRIHVEVFRPPVCCQSIQQTTWPGVANRFFCPRYHVFTAQNGDVLAAASALWVILDTQKRTIVPPAKANLPFPDTRDLSAPTALPNRLPACGDTATQILRTPTYCDFDINGHVNNTRYIAWLCDALGRRTLSNAFIGELTVGYEKEIREEMPLACSLAHNGNTFAYSIASACGEKHFIAGGLLKQEECAS